MNKEWDDYNLPRLTVLPWYIWACLIVLMIWATSALANDIPAQVLEKDGVTIRLMNSPCVDAVSVSMIRPSALGRFKALESVWLERDGSRKPYSGCWTFLTAEESGSEECFLVVFSDQQSACIPKSEFKKVKGQAGV